MDSFLSEQKGRFFSKLDWAAFWTATIVTFLVYFFTLGPSVGLEDSGELATAAANLGVPHPPGYPFWTFCSWLFCKVFFWVTYMGHPTPAWCVSLCSATFGAFAAGCTAMLICRSAHDFVGCDENTSGSAASLVPSPSALFCFGGGVAGALTFALSPVEWSQSTIVEIYSLNALFLMWVFLLSYRWMMRPSDKMLGLTMFVFGLGLTNYQVLLFAIVPLAIVIAFRNLGLFRDVFIYLIPVGLTYQILQVGQLMRADRDMQADVINKHEAIVGRVVSTPSTTVLALALLLLVAGLVAAAVLRHRGERERAERAVLYLGGSGAVLALLSAFVFVSKNSWSGITAPVAPLIDPTVYAWIGGFVVASVVAAALSSLRREKAAAGVDESSALLDRICAQLNRELWLAIAFALIAVVIAACVTPAGDGGYMGAKYPWGKSTGVCAALIVALFVLVSFTRGGLAFAVPVAGLHVAAFLLLSHGAMNGLTHPMSWWFAWPIAWNFILLALAWLTLPNGRSLAIAAFCAQLGVSFYIYMPVVSDLRNPPMNWGYPRTWEGFKHAIMRGQYEAIGVPTFPSVGAFFSFFFKQMGHYFGDVMVQFTDLLVFFAFVPFVAARWVVAKAQRKVFWQWMGAAAACFLMMSGLLILLANVKGDVQDGFIQKVKFISSHAMIALWIGYGLVFAALLAFRKFGRRSLPLAAVVALGMILVAGIYPIVQNYTDERMVFELGGNEQNGHTFGWQFGAYQLEGAKAINEQLVADEEPLPDPTYPPPMDKFSIFFGGTDPGRFVPTYMIYSAKFRPDVYLITQNALADDTYMSVERDLYGDEIWIPAKEDSAEAFNIYVDEVQRGVRQANGDLKIENGRVQVTGALGVMEINGILTKMMHDHDRRRHAFYVEESYVIPWMYPYLSPHGLILKINADQTPYDAKRAAQDMDFWDWYVRRLLDDPMYRRDFAGQKSFSKLRAAIAGLYNRQGRYRESAQAFREAVALYPASPEATFRYAQESLLPFRRWDVILELMDYTDSIDPNNRRTVGLRDYVLRIRQAAIEIERLEQKRRKDRSLSDQDTATLASLKYSIGRVSEAAQLLRPLIERATDPGLLRMMATVFLEARLDADAERTLNAFLKINPSTDANAWADLAKLQARQGRKQAAQQSFLAGYRIDAKGLFERLQKDQELYDLAAPLFQRRK